MFISLIFSEILFSFSLFMTFIIFETKKCLKYNQSRWYRSPEIIFEFNLPTTCKCDIWSLGCIVYEIFTYIPLFPGKTEYEQIDRYKKLLGDLDPEFNDNLKKTEKNNDLMTAKNVHSSIKSKYINDWSCISNPNMLEFIQKCLEWYPNNRINTDINILDDWSLE